MTWKLQIPLLRCPHCRNWVQVINRGEWKAQVPPKKLLERLRHDAAVREGPIDSTASPSISIGSRGGASRAREEAEE